MRRARRGRGRSTLPLAGSASCRRTSASTGSTGGGGGCSAAAGVADGGWLGCSCRRCGRLRLCGGRCRRRWRQEIRPRRWSGAGGSAVGCRGWSSGGSAAAGDADGCCRRSVGRLLRAALGAAAGAAASADVVCAEAGAPSIAASTSGAARTARIAQPVRLNIRESPPIGARTYRPAAAPDQPASASRPRIAAGSRNAATVKRHRRRNRSTGALGAVIVATLAQPRPATLMGARLIGCYRLGMRATTELEGQPRRDRLDIHAGIDMVDTGTPAGLNTPARC